MIWQHGFRVTFIVPSPSPSVLPSPKEVYLLKMLNHKWQENPSHLNIHHKSNMQILFHTITCRNNLNKVNYLTNITTKCLCSSLRYSSHISPLMGHPSRKAICDLMSVRHPGSTMMSISSSRAPDSSPHRAVNVGSSIVPMTVWAIWLRIDRTVTTGPTAWPILWRSWVVSKVRVMPDLGLYWWLHTGKAHGVGGLLYMEPHSAGLITFLPSGSPVHWQQRCFSMWWNSLCWCFNRYSSKPFTRDVMRVGLWCTLEVTDVQTRSNGSSRSNSHHMGSCYFPLLYL